MVSPFLPDADRLRALREALPAVGAGIYLNTADAGPLPAETAAAMAEIADHELRFGRAHAADAEDAAARREEARAALAAVVSADVGSVALTRGSADALAVALRGVDWRRGDRLVTAADPGVGIESASRGLAQRRGVEVVRVSARASSRDPDAEDDLVEPIAGAAADARTRAVALPHVTATGRLLPIAAIAAAVRATRRDVPILVDGRLAVGAIPVTADELGVDAYAIAGDAWLLGPTATGGLWLSADAGDRVVPELGGPDAVDADGRPVNDGRAFEPGALPTAAVVGIARSCGWLSMFVGLDWVLARAVPLAGEVLARLARTPGVEVLTPTAEGAHAGVVAFRLDRWPAGEAVAELGRRVFAIAGLSTGLADGRDAVRLSIACFNEPNELGRVCDAIELVAAHTPDSIPRRTALTIVGG